MVCHVLSKRLQLKVTFGGLQCLLLWLKLLTWFECRMSSFVFNGAKLARLSFERYQILSKCSMWIQTTTEWGKSWGIWHRLFWIVNLNRSFFETIKSLWNLPFGKRHNLGIELLLYLIILKTNGLWYAVVFFNAPHIFPVYIIIKFTFLMNPRHIIMPKQH